MPRVLFVCGKNRRRSPTAEAIFSGRPGVEVSSAGTAADADCPVSGDLIDWADIILVMEPRHARQLRKRFGPLLRDKRIISLDIPDNYDLMEPQLVELLQARVPPRLP